MLGCGGVVLLAREGCLEVMVRLERGRTDAEEEEGEQGDGVAAEFPAQRAGRGGLLRGLHGVAAAAVAATASCDAGRDKLTAWHHWELRYATLAPCRRFGPADVHPTRQGSSWSAASYSRYIAASYPDICLLCGLQVQL
jgi:hypothetical protein